MHSRAGSVAVRLNGGGAAILSSDDANATAFRVAHGALMLAAFVLLMPVAVLMARHKYLFGDAKVRGGRLCTRPAEAASHCCARHAAPAATALSPTVLLCACRCYRLTHPPPHHQTERHDQCGLVHAAPLPQHRCWGAGAGRHHPHLCALPVGWPCRHRKHLHRPPRHGHDSRSDGADSGRDGCREARPWCAGQGGVEKGPSGLGLAHAPAG
jgi:hypothetical protein